MNADEFLTRHGLALNPFTAEDAGQDAVLARTADAWKHPDFAKIIGDPTHPSPTVVFGERGAGKTALRLQMEHFLAHWNQRRSTDRTLVVAHDDFDGMLSTIARHDGLREPKAALESIRLSDHVDAILHRVVPLLVDQLLRMPKASVLHGSNMRRALSKSSIAIRRDMLLLQVAYDHPSAVVRRTRRVRSALRCSGSSGAMLAGAWSLLLLAIAAVMGLIGIGATLHFEYLLPAAVMACVGVMVGWTWVLRKARVARISRRMAKAIRVLQRDARGFRGSLHLLPMELIETSLPQDRGEDARYAMLDRLHRVLGAVGYASLSVLVDRVDEPACVAGDAQHMRNLVWPMLSSRFLQHPGLAVKLLLPKELGEMAAREDGDFHRGARLDKQNMIERLHWTGAMLAELCDARLRAATASGSKVLKVEELFDPSVGRSRLSEAMERSGNPREALRLVYGAIQEHLSHANADEHLVSAASFEWARRKLGEARQRG